MFGFHEDQDYGVLQLITRRKCWFPWDYVDEQVTLVDVITPQSGSVERI